MTLWITEDDVRQCVSLNDTVAALEEGLPQEARGEAENLDKALATWGGKSSMHALGSLMPHRGYVGFKTWANTPDGAMAVFSLFDAVAGQLLAMIEAAALGQMRTSGISGVATRLLAKVDANEMALIGTGVQAPMQVAAIAATRRLRRVRVFSPSPDKRSAFMARARAMFPFEMVECASVEEAVRDMPIVTLITRATEPFLHADMLAPGTHVNAAGAILPGNREFHPDLWARTTRIVVDNINNARKASAELIDHFGNGAAGWDRVQTLGQALLSVAGRTDGDDITIFKPMGMGLSDLCVAALAYERSRDGGLGTQLPQGRRAPPHWTVVA